MQRDGTAAGPRSAPPTARERAKADRRTALLAAAARQFGARGYDGVSIEELGSAAGVSGPAVYRHFASKQDVLAALLLEPSTRLHDGGHAVVAQAPDAPSALRALVAFHVDFALGEPDVIRVQDRDLPSLGDADRRTVRALQRRYVELWVDVLQRLRPDADEAELRLRAHATFGLLNSTPHSAARVPSETARPWLEQMALAALGHPGEGAAG